jgi:hypothetical protein
MSRRSTLTKESRGREYADSPVAWFVMLERARQESDFEAAAQAQRELKRLGVIVRFSSTATRREGGGRG